MAPTSEPSARRGRRMLAALTGVAASLAAAATLMTPPTSAAEPPTGPIGRSARPTDLFTPTPTPSPCDAFSYDPACATPTPSPTYVVVSPVPFSPSPAPTTPSYLQGTEPSPSPHTGDTVSSPVPLGGGFVDQLPTPSTGPSVPVGGLAPHQAGLPLPFLVVGALLILGAVGSLIYALAPREKNVFAGPRGGSTASPVLFTPYGPDTPGTSILSAPQPPRPGSK
jgi:hypothetical protein